MNARFAALLAAARAEVAPSAGAAATPAAPGAAGRAPQGLLYRRAVPTDARRGVAPPPPPVPGLRLASNGVAVLVSEEFPARRLRTEDVDAALHAARAAGAVWVAAWVASPGDVAVLRELGFQPMPDAAPGGPAAMQP